MRRVTAVMFSIALTAGVLAIYLIPQLIYVLYQPRPPPLEEAVPYIKVEEGGSRYVIEKPLAWGEVFKLFLNEMASYRYILNYDEIELLKMYIKYVNNMLNSSNPCEVVVREYTRWWNFYAHYWPLFDNDCAFLKKIFFGSEREWYVTLAVVPNLAEEFAKKYKDYSVWVLIYFENGSMVVELYNVVNPSEAEALLRKYSQLIGRYPKLAVLLDRELRWTWYEDYKQLEESGVPYIFVFEATSNTVVTPPLKNHFDTYNLEYYSSQAVLYKGGVPHAVYIVAREWCSGVGIPCVTTMKDLLAFN